MIVLFAIIYGASEDSAESKSREYDRICKSAMR
jgi:hypothetical protein